MSAERTTDNGGPFDFSPERPIVTKANDLLGRSPFADRIADAVTGWKGKDSLVIALCGDWGSGKSSLKNLVLEKLREEPKTAPHTLEFEPWQWSGQEQVFKAFFRELSSQLGLRDSTEQARRRAKSWKKYAAALGVGEAVFGGAQRIGMLLLAPIVGTGVLAIAASFFDIVVARWLLAAVVVAAAGLIAILSASRWFASRVSAWFDAVAESQEKPLAELKRELSASLQELEKPIFVVIDDLDRLVASEILLVFQLIKSNADFPNVVYLVLFHKPIVEEAISSQCHAHGRDYLEKIVQVTFDVPKIEQARLDRVLFAKLDAMVESDAVKNLWDQDRWAAVWVEGIQPYFENLRDVYRFASALSFAFSMFAKDGSFEVNPVDLIALEVVRVFEPDVFRVLSGLKKTLTGISHRESIKEVREPQERQILEGLVAKANPQRAKNLRELLTRVFPPIRWTLGAGGSGVGLDEWFRQHRACHADHFDKYFQMAIAEGDLAVQEIEEVVGLAGDRGRLATKLDELRKRGLLDKALQRLEAYKETIPPDRVSAFITAIFDVGDGLEPTGAEMLMLSPQLHAARIVYHALKREPDINQRCQVLTESIALTSGIDLPVFVVVLERDKANKKQGLDSRLVDDSCLPALEQQCVSKIVSAAVNGSLIDHKGVASLTVFWREHGTADAAVEWAGDLIDSPRELLKFLRSCMGETRIATSGSYRVKSKWRLELRFVEPLLPLNKILDALAAVNESDLTQGERETSEAFRQAFRERARGRSGASPFDEA